MYGCQVIPTDGVATNWTFWCEAHDHGTFSRDYCHVGATGETSEPIL